MLIIMYAGCIQYMFRPGEGHLCFGAVGCESLKLINQK